MKFIAIRVRNSIVMHGYTNDNTEIVEEIKGEEFVEKLISIERIQSVSEKYILVSSSHGRVLYDTDAQVSPLPSVAPLLVRRSFSR